MSVYDWKVDGNIWRRIARDGGQWAMWHARSGWGLAFGSENLGFFPSLAVAMGISESRDECRIG